MDPERRNIFVSGLYRKICRGYALAPFGGRTVLILGRHSKSRSNGTEDVYARAVPGLETCFVPGDHRTMITEYAEDLAECRGQSAGGLY